MESSVQTPTQCEELSQEDWGVESWRPGHSHTDMRLCETTTRQAAFWKPRREFSGGRPQFQDLDLQVFHFRIVGILFWPVPNHYSSPKKHKYNSSQIHEKNGESQPINQILRFHKPRSRVWSDHINPWFILPDWLALTLRGPDLKNLKTIPSPPLLCFPVFFFAMQRICKIFFICKNNVIHYRLELLQR